MVTTPAAGPITTAEDLLRATLADCTTFRTWAGAANQAEALAKIYHDAIPRPASHADVHSKSDLASLRPYAIVWTEEVEGYRLRADAVGSDFEFHHGDGSLWIRFEQDVPTVDDDEIDRRFKNSLGQIMQSGDAANPGLAELAGRPGYLTITSITLNGPFRVEPDKVQSEGDWQGALLEIGWGIAS